jgi:hypothetical protein
MSATSDEMNSVQDVPTETDEDHSLDVLVDAIRDLTFAISALDTTIFEQGGYKKKGKKKGK